MQKIEVSESGEGAKTNYSQFSWLEKESVHRQTAEGSGRKKTFLVVDQYSVSQRLSFYLIAFHIFATTNVWNGKVSITGLFVSQKPIQLHFLFASSGVAILTDFPDGV